MKAVFKRKGNRWLICCDSSKCGEIATLRVDVEDNVAETQFWCRKHLPKRHRKLFPSFNK